MPPPKVNKNRKNNDGYQGIARGMTRQVVASTKEELLEGKSEKDKARIAKYMEGPHAHESKERRKLLQHADENHVLSEKEERTQTKRRTHDKQTSATLDRYEVQRLQAAVAASDAQLVLHTESPGMVEAEHDLERTSRLSQVDLKTKHLNAQSARNIFDLQLPHHAPYGVHYDRSGKFAALVGSRGHVSVMDNQAQALVTEFHLPGERLRDATFLHNSSMLAVAQSNHVYIYDTTSGAEVHKLSDHQDPFCVDFLPHHWLLVSIGRAGWLKYHDTSTGDLISQHRTQQGSSKVMRQNPSNAIVHVGHKNGSVTLWSPATPQYLCKMQCHKGAPLTSLAVQGNYMVTGGADRQVKVWDLRMMHKESHAYYAAAGIPTSLDISQRGVLGIGHGSTAHATFWKSLDEKHSDPYMHHSMPGCGVVETLRFRPYEDVVGIGHNKGISSIVIPGSGEPNVDSSSLDNPYADTKQSREMEVRSLMDKLSPNMISMDPNVVGSIEVSAEFRQARRAEQQLEENSKKGAKKKKQKTKKRGRSKIQTQLRRKAANVVDEATVKLKERKKEQEEARKQEQADKNGTSTRAAPAALQRFFT